MAHGACREIARLQGTVQAPGFVLDGVTWHEAMLDTRHEPWAWRRWSLAWTPSKPGKTTLVARATDSRGAVQPREAVWNPSGYFFNSWHSADVEVTA